METELILKLDGDFVERIKAYAAKNKISLSRLFENQMAELISEKKKITIEDLEITPYVRSISTGLKPAKDVDIKAEYHEHQLRKHS